MASPRMRILVVDDSADLRHAVATVLQQAGHAAITAPGGEAGLAIVERRNIEVVILDMMMPEMDGLQFLDRLKALAPPLPKVVAMSGFASFEQAALDRGAAAFLRKPFAPETLLDVVTTVRAGAVPALEARARALDECQKMRREADDLRDSILEKINLSSPSLAARLKATVRWCAGYFDVPTVSARVVRTGVPVLRVRWAGTDEGSEPRPNGAASALCDAILEAGTPAVVPDVAASAPFAGTPLAGQAVRFFAGAPIRTAAGAVLGALALIDTRPRVFFAEDLGIVETISEGLARHLELLSRGDEAAARELPVQGVVIRAVFTIALAAELRRIARSGGGLELASIETEVLEPGALARVAEVVYETAGRRRLAISTGDGSIDLLVGSSVAGAARPLMELAVGAVRGSAKVRRGAILALEGVTSQLLDGRSFEAMVREARLRVAPASAGAGAVERIVLTDGGPVTA